ncbi:hypothetical protein J2S40_004689 [Nocardioides luteus]|uniref:DUF2867 domain-containing protein n=1 Tax=Nocardioides luteus TaxID=1844 RepID=A0ABQ5T236_9ACTN|nr:DUF2867 domain-containing protein [Nocardioides luteus]MDR7313631.1 hypothetical protein [Nocardioides luteus]GGR64379.1 hypothetical protein GCM10010197_34880 [Nocardioides luteus]GLJ70522.1 hypothetical protein GCM10017579_45580 [Nocardioides luteus]
MTTQTRTRPLPSGAYSGQPWRIHEIAGDFDLEDTWALPAHGDAGDFPRFVEAMMSTDSREFPAAYRFLFAVRWALGRVLGTDADQHGLGHRVTPLRDRLPEDLRDRPVPERDTGPFEPLYLTDREYAAEIANRTVHGVLHLGWAEDATAPGGHTAQLSVLVRPNGRLGEAYLAFIKPFRYAVVYPALLRTVGRRWDSVRSVAR